MPLDFVWAIELNRLGLELIGLWPKTNEAIKDTFVSDIRVGMVFFVVTFLSIIPLLCSFVRVWGDMILIVDNLQVTLPLIVVSLKLVIIRWKRTGICISKINIHLILGSLLNYLLHLISKLYFDIHQD